MEMGAGYDFALLSPNIYTTNHNYNKILDSDWLSAAMI